jgi:hypothetical protein
MITAAARGLKCLLIDTASLRLQISILIIANLTENVNQEFKMTIRIDKFNRKIQNNFTEYTLLSDIML